jgi:hypothetical protein
MWGTTERRQSHSKAGGESRYSMPSRNKNRSAAARLRLISSRQLRQFTNAYLLALVPILSTWNLTPLADLSIAQRTGPALPSDLQEPSTRAMKESLDCTIATLQAFTIDHLRDDANGFTFPSLALRKYSNIAMEPFALGYGRVESGHQLLHTFQCYFTWSRTASRNTSSKPPSLKHRVINIT